MDAAQRLVVPVGQYGGAVREQSVVGPVGHAIRRGPMVFTVPPQPATLWMEAHGRRADIGGTAWTRSTILDRRADEMALAEAETAFGHLAVLHLIREFTPDGPEALEFARTHRLLPAAHGLGNTSDDPFRFLVGHPPHRTARLEWNEMRLWRDGYQEPSLWDACLARVAAEERVGYALDPGRLLVSTLGSLHLMLALRLTYVDVAAHAGDDGPDP
jgi:hypothetical protein